MTNERSYTYGFLLLLIIVSVLIISTIFLVQFNPGVDEGYYFKYARAFTLNGFSAFKGLAADFLSNRDNWVFPNPLRIGYVIFAGIFCKIFGISFISLAYLSFASFIALLIVSYTYSKRFFDGKTAMLFSILLSFSPLLLALSRRALLDSTSGLFTILCAWILFDILEKRYNLGKALFFVISCSLAILVKETNILPIFALAVIFILFAPKKNILVFLKKMTLLFILPVVIVSCIYLSVFGNLKDVLKIIRVVGESVNTNRYAFLAGNGPWYRYLIDFMLLSPVVFILGILNVTYAIDRDKPEKKEIYFFVFVVLLLFMFSFLTKNIRYLAFLDIPLRLFSVLSVLRISKMYTAKHFFFIALMAVLLFAFFDYSRFLLFFVEFGIYDPISVHFLRVLKIIPFQ